MVFQNMRIILLSTVFFLVPIISIVYAQSSDQDVEPSPISTYLSFGDRLSLEFYCRLTYCHNKQGAQERETMEAVANSVDTIREVIIRELTRDPDTIVQGDTIIVEEQTVVQNITNNPEIERIIEREIQTVRETTFLSEEEVERLEDLIRKARRTGSNSGGSDDQELTFDSSSGVLSISGGNSVTISGLGGGTETLTTLVASGTDTLIYTDENGASSTITLAGTLTTLRASGSDLLYIDEEGATTTITITGSGIETLTTITDNGDGSFTYTNESGATTTISISDLLSSATGTLTIDSLEVTGTTTLSGTTTITGPTTLSGTTTTDNIENSGNILTNAINAVTGFFTNLFATTATIDSLTATTTQTNTLTITNPATGTTTDNLLVIDPTTGEVGEIAPGDIVTEFETLTVVSFATSTGLLTYLDEEGATTTINLQDYVSDQLATGGITSATGTITLGGATTTVTIPGALVVSGTSTLATTTISAATIESLILNPIDTGTSTDDILVRDTTTGEIKRISATNLFADLETLTSFAASGTELVYVDEEGSTTTIDVVALTGASSTDELITSTSFSSTTNTLSIDEGGILFDTILDGLSTFTLTGTTTFNGTANFIDTNPTIYFNSLPFLSF